MFDDRYDPAGDGGTTVICPVVASRGTRKASVVADGSTVVSVSASALPTCTLVPGQKPLPFIRTSDPGWSREGAAPEVVVESSVAAGAALSSGTLIVRSGNPGELARTSTEEPNGINRESRLRRSVGSAIRLPPGGTVALGTNSAVTPAGRPSAASVIVFELAKSRARRSRRPTSTGAQWGRTTVPGDARARSNADRTLTGT